MRSSPSRAALRRTAASQPRNRRGRLRVDWNVVVAETDQTIGKVALNLRTGRATSRISVNGTLAKSGRVDQPEDLFPFLFDEPRRLALDLYQAHLGDRFDAKAFGRTILAERGGGPLPVYVEWRCDNDEHELVIATPSELTAEEAEGWAVGELWHAVLREFFTEAMTAAETAAALERACNLIVYRYKRDEAARRRFVHARRRAREAARLADRAGRAPPAASLPDVPMYILASAHTKHKSPQRVAARVMALLGVPQEEIAKRLGVARAELGDAVNEHNGGTFDAAHLRRDLGWVHDLWTMARRTSRRLSSQKSPRAPQNRPGDPRPAGR